MSLSKLTPDWQAADLHGQSTVPGIPLVNKPINQQLVCPCCLNILQKSKAPICENSKQLQFLGFGFPLFYVFLKYCIILLFVNIASYNAIALYWNFQQQDANCKQIQAGCTSIMVAVACIKKKVQNEEIVIRIFSFMMHLMSLVYIRDLIIKTRNYYDQRTCSLSDYSILVTGLPLKMGIRQKVKQLLACGFQKSYFPAEMTFLPDYPSYFQLEYQYQQIIKKMKKLMKNQEENAKQLADLFKKLQKKQEQISKFCEKQIKLEENDQCLSQKIIFSCQCQDEKDEIIQNFAQVSKQKIRSIFQIAQQDQCQIQFQEAPQPKQIIWQNINYNQHKRLGRMVIGWIMTLLFLGIITSIFFYVLSQKSFLIQHTDHHLSSYIGIQSLVYIALVVVILFNKFVMGKILHLIVDFQRHPTTAIQQFHYSVKFSVGLFFTTALMTLAVQDLHYRNFYDHPYGVIQEQSLMFVMNAFFVPLIWLINPWQLVVRLKRRLSYGKKGFTQKQANKIMQNCQYMMGKRYAQIVEVIWFTSLYATLIPAGAFFSLIGLSLYYWIDKYNLLRRSSVNSNIAGELSLYSMKLLDLSLICKPIGQLIFDSQIRDSYCISSIVMCGIGLLYIFIPMDDILDFLHNQKFKKEQKRFQQVEHLFKQTYQTMHPIYSLKKQNQQKMYAVFNSLQLQEDSATGLKCENMSVGSVQKIALRDATTLLQALFKKFDIVPEQQHEEQKEKNVRKKVQWKVNPLQMEDIE